MVQAVWSQGHLAGVAERTPRTLVQGVSSWGQRAESSHEPTRAQCRGSLTTGGLQPEVCFTPFKTDVLPQNCLYTFHNKHTVFGIFKN